MSSLKASTCDQIQDAEKQLVTFAVQWESYTALPPDGHLKVICVAVDLDVKQTPWPWSVRQ